jgi:hypothetical protein
MAATRAAEGAPHSPGADMVAAAAAPTKITSQYLCNLSGYGASIPAATLSATLTIPASVVADSSFDVTLATTASDALPAAVLTALNGVTSFDLSANVTQQPGTSSASSPVALAGTGQAPATLTALPAVTSTGTGKFVDTGTGVVVAPAQTLTITPHTSAAALAAITCTTTAATQNVKVAVTPATVGTSGPLYACVLSLASTNLDTIDWHVPGTITSSGTRSTGKTDTVTYDTAAFGSFEPASSVSVAASLPVTGAQPGQISLSQSIDPSSSAIKASGKLALNKAGTDHILLPSKITITLGLTAGGVTVTTKTTCTPTKTPTPEGLTMSVTKAAGSPEGSGSPIPTPTPSPTSTQTGIPVGAPDTGGGTSAGVSVGTAAAGGVIAVSGGGLLLFGRRRRGRQRRG